MQVVDRERPDVVQIAGSFKSRAIEEQADYSNTAHSKRFSRLAGLLPLLGLDLAKVELEFLALKMEKIYQVYSKFRNSSRPLLL